MSGFRDKDLLVSIKKDLLKNISEAFKERLALNNIHRIINLGGI